MRDFLKMVGVLFIVCGLAAGSLAVVNMVTREPIARYEQLQRESAIRDVSPNADEFKEITAGKVWEARRQGQAAGHVFLTQIQGYSGPISLMMGVDPEGAVTGLRVLIQTETPGLGARIATSEFQNQFQGKRREQIALKKDDPTGGQIDAITAATISSRAVTRAARAALDAFDNAKAGEGK